VIVSEKICAWFAGSLVLLLTVSLGCRTTEGKKTVPVKENKSEKQDEKKISETNTSERKDPPKDVEKEAKKSSKNNINCQALNNYNKCMKITYKNGAGLRRAPCRDNTNVFSVLPEGATVCAAKKEYTSSCGEPYTYIYVASQGYIMEYDPVSNTRIVDNCQDDD
jgi:hypothetical protein